MSPTDTTPATRPTREETRERLLDGAYAAFCEVGFQAATLEDVCARAGFTRGAFYSNFVDKDELLLALWNRISEGTAAAIRARVAQLEGTERPFEVLIDDLIDMRAPDRDWFVLSTEFLLHSLRTPEIQARVVATRTQFREALGEGVGITMAAQGIRPPDGMDVDTFAQLLIAGHLGCQHANSTNHGDADLARSMLRALVAACRPVDGSADHTACPR